MGLAGQITTHPVSCPGTVMTPTHPSTATPQIANSLPRHESAAMISDQSTWALSKRAPTASAGTPSMALAILAMPLLALTSRRLQRLFLAVVVLGISLQVQKHFFLRQDAADFGSLGGLQISLTNIALAVLYAGWLIDCVTGTRLRQIKIRAIDPVSASGVLFLLFCAVSLFACADRTLGLFELANTGERLLLYLYIVNRLRSRDDVIFIVRVVLCSLILQALFMSGQAMGSFDSIDWYGIKASANFAGDHRVSGTLGSPNPAAAYLAMCMVLAASVALSGAKRFDRWLSGAALTLAFIPLFATLSRGGWLSLVLGATVLLLVSRSRLSSKLATAGIILLILWIVELSPPVQERLFGDDRGSSAARMPLNRLAIAMIEDHPICGVGVNNFSLAMRPYLSQNLSGDYVYTVHNAYLRIWSETGTGGLLAFLWFLFLTLHRAFRAWQMRDHLYAFLSLGCGSAVAGFMLQMNFDPFRAGAPGHMLWLFAGLIGVMHRLSLDSGVTASA